MRHLLASLAISATLAPPARAQGPVEPFLAGTVSVVEQGSRRPAREGSFTLCFESDGAWSSELTVAVAVNAGEFRAEIPHDTQRLSIGRMRIEGCEALCRWAGAPSDAANRLDLVAQLVPETRVRVHRQGSEAELGRCAITEEDEARPSRIRALPYVVPPRILECSAFGWKQSRRLYVWAPGSPRQVIDVDLLAGGDVWVELVPEAKLELDVARSAGAPPHALRLGGPDGTRIFRDFAQESERASFDGLVAGRYTIDADFAAGNAASTRRAEFELAAGETKTLALDWTQDQPPARAAIRGTLVMDPAWQSELGTPTLQLLAFDSIRMQWARGACALAPISASGEWPWDGGQPAVGRCFFWLKELAWGTPVDVAEGMGPVALRVPPRARCTVRLVDSETALLLPPAELLWRAAPAELRGVEYAKAKCAEGSATFTLDAPFGPLTMIPQAEGYSARVRTKQVTEDPADVTVRMVPLCRMRVRLACEERAVAFPQGVRVLARRVDGSGDGWGYASAEDVHEISDELEGTYELTLPAFAGYREPAAIRVEAKRRQVLEVVFRLEREGGE